MKIFKRILLVTAALCLALGMVSCADNGKSKNTSETDDETGISYSVKYNGTTIKLGGAADSTIKALGEPQSKEEKPGCAGLGTLLKYTYPSINLYVLESDSGNTVDQIDFRDDLVSTPEGVTIGMSRSDVIAKCGEADSEDPVFLTYTKGKLNLTFKFDSNSKVTAISYIREGA